MSHPACLTTQRPSAQWKVGPAGEARGFIDSGNLRELWFHTGTNCNLRCPFCLEGSKPGDQRLEAPSLDELRPFMNEAIALGVAQLSFTGGEPFVVPDFLDILTHAASLRPCLVLTNGTQPLLNKLNQLAALRSQPHPIRFRISLDSTDAQVHDAGRGEGNFRRSIQAAQRLLAAGFPVSIARQRTKGEPVETVDTRYREVLLRSALPPSLPIVSFPDFLRPFATGHSPVITETCMTTYHSPESLENFMCSYSRMVIKQNGAMRVYACTLVDDDPDYDLGGTLAATMETRIMLKHQRCFACFAHGASCSERSTITEAVT